MLYTSAWNFEAAAAVCTRCKLENPAADGLAEIHLSLLVQERGDMFELTGRDFALLNKRGALLHPELCIPSDFWMRPARTVVWGRKVSDAMVSFSCTVNMSM